jgi:hypothetical protein
MPLYGAPAQNSCRTPSAQVEHAIHLRRRLRASTPPDRQRRRQAGEGKSRLHVSSLWWTRNDRQILLIGLSLARETGMQRGRRFLAQGALAVGADARRMRGLA